MFSRLISAIYSGPSRNFSQPCAQFTRRGGRTFSELHGIDHTTTIRAIAEIWFPRACEFENPREKGLIRNPGTQEKAKETLDVLLN
jgi:hypothetical protein